MKNPLNNVTTILVDTKSLYPKLLVCFVVTHSKNLKYNQYTSSWTKVCVCVFTTYGFTEWSFFGDLIWKLVEVQNSKFNVQSVCYRPF